MIENKRQFWVNSNPSMFKFCYFMMLHFPVENCYYFQFRLWNFPRLIKCSATTSSKLLNRWLINWNLLPKFETWTIQYDCEAIYQTFWLSASWAWWSFRVLNEYIWNEKIELHVWIKKPLFKVYKLSLRVTLIVVPFLLNEKLN